MPSAARCGAKFSSWRVWNCCSSSSPNANAWYSVRVVPAGGLQLRVTGGVAVVDRDCAAHVPTCLTFDSHRPPGDGMSGRPFAVRLPPPFSGRRARLATAVQSKQNRSDECHQRALTGFIGTVKTFSPGKQTPVLSFQTPNPSMWRLSIFIYDSISRSTPSAVAASSVPAALYRRE